MKIYWRKIDLPELKQWVNDELKAGNERKAARIYKVFCKYVRLHYPKVRESQLRNYNNWYWNIN